MRNDDSRPPAPAKVLLTGFGPFPGVPDNVSAKVVAALATAVGERRPNVQVVTAVLPTHWERGPALAARLIDELAPAVVVHFGVASECAGLRIETTAVNVCGMTSDVSGAFPTQNVLCIDGPDQRLVSFAASEFVQELSDQGWPVSLSDNAGHYLCNAVFYATLEVAQRAADEAWVAFIHIPRTLSDASVTLETTVNAAYAFIDLCLIRQSRPYR